MYASRSVRKGEIIELFVPEILLPMNPFKISSLKRKKIKSSSLSQSSSSTSSSLFDDMDLCKSCGRSMWAKSESQIISAVSNLPRFQVGQVITTNLGQSETMAFCSSRCKEVFDDIMKFGVETKKFFYSLLGNSTTKYRDEKDVALLVASFLYRTILQGEVDPLLHKQFASSTQCSNLNDDDDVSDDRILDCWLILRSEINLKTDIDVELTSSLSFFHSIYKFIRESCIFEVTITHPIQKYIQSTILKLSDKELADSFEILRTYLPSVASTIDEDSDSISANVLLWRIAARITQASSNRDGLEDDQLSMIIDTQTRKCIKGMFQTYFAYCPNINLHHSCVPNTIVEAHENEDGCTSIALVALHDIDMGQILTVSKIDDIEVNIQERWKQLESVFGKGYMCSCTRCRYEQLLEDGKKIVIREDNAEDKTIRQNTFHWRDLKYMADLAMQHGKYKTAKKLYTIILNENPNLGDVLHARCASVLESGNFLMSQMLWKEAFQLCPSHSGISLQVRKQNAYNQDMESVNDDVVENHDVSQTTLNLPRYETLVPSKCFMTLSDSPLISPDECKKAIDWAESAATSRTGGWTTSRHYAVPTTDIPIHEIPPLLKWFNALFSNRIRPLMAAQFGEQNVGKQGRNIFIHDAFIVRYDASGGQKHLPLHRDQSTHSFTVALNSSSDYDGGGTYVAALKRSIRPSIGGMTSFRGDELLHGGDPVVLGRRYIIVAFCYVSHLENKAHPVGKKMKLDAQFHKKSTTGTSLTQNENNAGFTFGFQLG